MQLGFNPTQYQPLNGFELLEPGDYPVTITDVTAERTNDQNSGLLKIAMKVQQGHPSAGRTLFHRINLWNTDPEVKSKAHQNLTALCYAVGITTTLNDTDELKNKQLIVTINKGQYNNVTTVKDMSGNAPGRQPLQAAAPGGFGGAPAQGGFPQGATPGGFNPGSAPVAQGNGNPFAAPASAPAIPAAAPAVPQAAPFPPDGWQPHPQSPGWFWKGTEAITEAELRQRYAQAPAAAAPANPFSAPAGATPFGGSGFVAPQGGAAPNPAAGFQGGGQAAMPSGWPQN